MHQHEHDENNAPNQIATTPLNYQAQLLPLL
jgi:hypothetical protein